MAYSLPVTSYQQPAFGNGGNQSNALQLLLQLVQQNQGAQNEARQANESRYNDILDLLGGARTRSLSNLDNLSGQQVADADKTYTDMRHELLGKLPYGASRQVPINLAVQRERDAAVNRIKDQLALNRNAADSGFTDRATGVMERRTDSYPQNSNISALVAQLAPLLGGQVGGQLGGKTNGGQQSIRSGGPPQPPQGYTYDNRSGQMIPNKSTVMAQHRAQDAQDQAAEQERLRRGGMQSLTSALNYGGLEGEDRVRSALAYLQQNGWAQQNPAATANVPRVQAMQTYGSPAPSYSRPGSWRDYGNPNYNQQLQAYATANGRYTTPEAEGWQPSPPASQQQPQIAGMYRNPAYDAWGNPYDSRYQGA